MAVFESYRPLGTWADRVDPRTKLVWLLAVLLTAFTAQSPLALVTLSLVVIIVARAAGIAMRNFRHPSLILALVTVQLIILQLLFNREGTVLWQAGPIAFYSQAVPLALIASLRLSAIVLASVQFLQWTPPGDITLLLMKAKIPYRFAMLAGLAMRFLPLMEKELWAIYEIQATRGVPSETALQKLKGLLPVTLPFLYRSFRRANETALAMELRGFGRNPSRTFLYDLNMRGGEMAAVVFMVFLALYQLYLTYT